MSTVIYYFTATGNSLFVAKELGKAIGSSRIVPIIKAMDEDVIEIDEERIGIVFPLYYGGIPKIVEEFLGRIKVHGNRYVFAVATRGVTGGMIGKQISKIMREKGIQLKYTSYITMPANYVRMYDMKSQNHNERVIARARESVKNIGRDICMQKNCIAKEGTMANVLFSPMYKVWKSSSSKRDMSFNVNELCNSCGLCVKVCPVNNIILDEGRPKWMHNCEDCMACIQMCPQTAVNIGRATRRRRRYKNPFISFEEIAGQKKNEFSKNNIR